MNKAEDYSLTIMGKGLMYDYNNRHRKLISSGLLLILIFIGNVILIYYVTRYCDKLIAILFISLSIILSIVLHAQQVKYINITDKYYKYIKPWILFNIFKNNITVSDILKLIYIAEEQFRTAAIIDANRNGLGEYGYLVELSGTMECRVIGKRLESIYLPRIFNKETTKIGNYCYSLFLCDSDEANSGSSNYSKNNGITIRESEVNEKIYMCYAWPSKNRKEDKSVYAISSDGRIMLNPNNGANPLYGDIRKPSWCAAFTESTNWLKGRYVESGEVGLDINLPDAWNEYTEQ